MRLYRNMRPIEGLHYKVGIQKHLYQDLFIMYQKKDVLLEILIYVVLMLNDMK